MMESLWIVLGGIGAVALLIGLARFAAALRPDPDSGDLPSTPLEQLGWIGMAVTCVVGVGLAVIVIVAGASGFHRDGLSRGIFWVLLMAGLGVWMLGWRRLRGQAGSVVVDERDRDILARSFTVESAVVIVSLVAWTVTLTEVFWEEGAVPLEYLQLLFWSTFVLGAFGRSLGIVLGYRRDPRVHA